MKVIVKLIIIMLCAFLHFSTNKIDMKNTAIMLIILILTSIPLITKSDINSTKLSKIFINTLYTTCLVAALFIPEFIFFIPVLIMDLLTYRMIIPGVICIFCLIINLTENNGFLLLLLSVVTSLLQYTTLTNEELGQELRILRDNSKEKELLIKEKNRRLIEKQDSEIYTATLKERNRIAREIHDNVGHMLTRSILQVGAIKTINNNETLSQPLEDLHETLNTAMTNIRSSVHDLHDESLDLKTAIQEIIDGVDSLHFNFDYDIKNNIPKNIKYCFISITKEAVNNTLKHSNASHMIISIQEHPGFYQFLIQDNGTNTSKVNTSGIGITNMKDRIKSLNGNIKISSDDGFKILITISKG